ncbi:metallophosphoesterase [Magnetococcus sp. PR-3]|uniref:metallophosphoesterase n=1 Tax=Magnetococcus sp. PR-3 TaxID=3120355 RepID=UPI002FCDFB1B
MITDMLTKLFRPPTQPAIRPTEPMRLMGERIRIDLSALPLTLTLGRNGSTILVMAEPGHSDAIMLVNPTRYFDRAHGFIRLKLNTPLILGRDQPQQQSLFGLASDVAMRHVELRLTAQELCLKELHTDFGMVVAPADATLKQQIQSLKNERLETLLAPFPDPLQPLAAPEALDLLQRAATSQQQDPFRPKNSLGNLGSLLELPEHMEPILVGDLHACVENLLAILNWGGLWDGLQSGTQALIILGDGVHSERDGQLDQMESSILMMDLILHLKTLFPQQVFYLRGNHDSFSPRISKGGVPQGKLWLDALLERRGESYVALMDEFYNQLPLVAAGHHFLSTHAAPPRAKADRDMIINAQNYPGLVNELLWNRMRGQHYPSGYTKGDIKRFRKGMGLPPETPFIVSHTPLNRNQTLWIHAGEMENHHIVFSGLSQEIGLFVGLGDCLIPLILPTVPCPELVSTPEA